MGNARQFAANLKRFGEESEESAIAYVNGVVFRIYMRIVSDPEHPVDTGRARAGWAISVYEVGSYVPAKGATRWTGPRSDYAPKSAEQLAASFENVGLEAKRFIYNNVEYILWLEEGARGRPGAHMAARAIQAELAR